MKKKEFEIELVIRVTVYDQDIEDIMVTALEGGIGYWACLDNGDERFELAPAEESVAETCARILLDGGSVTLLDDEDHGTSWILTLDKLTGGITKFLETSDGPNCIECNYNEDGFEIDTCQIDADRADAIIQYALFGEIVYG